MTDPTAFVLGNTLEDTPPLVPEVRLRLASEITPIWLATEAWLAERNIAPPFWAFAWPGSQALARHVLDNPGLVAGKRVLDFAAGGGLAAIACMIAGAASAETAEIDRIADAATQVNAALNGVAVRLGGDVVGQDCRWDVIVTGDVCYEAATAGHIMPWLRRMARTAEVWMADPGRAYLPTEGMEAFAEYAVPTTRELEDREERRVALYRVLP